MRLRCNPHVDLRRSYPLPMPGPELMNAFSIVRASLSRKHRQPMSHQTDGPWLPWGPGKPTPRLAPLLDALAEDPDSQSYRPSVQEAHGALAPEPRQVEVHGDVLLHMQAMAFGIRDAMQYRDKHVRGLVFGGRCCK
uniref:Uncharacterized protein n=1 Tax=Eutreptiella gymnastica TaxID=73025 RepID=A0A7S1J7U8_9EUGL|mmetsp:Transcript_73718/g.129929  ORF Transcript_73718/g.129929 Transcript_73718/m.129929 type:complete len:137 (+) Transcript_73718:652-1062(+)